MDDPDTEMMENLDSSCAWLEGFPVTASLGPAGPLIKQLRSLTTVADVVSKDEIQMLAKNLEALCISLQNQSEMAEPSFTAKCWMTEVRELCYDTKNYLDDAPFISKQDEHDDAQLTPEEKQENAQFAFQMLEARVKHANKRRERYGFDQQQCIINKPKLVPSEGRRRLLVSFRELILIDGDRLDNLGNMIWRKDKGDQLKVVSLVGLEGVGKTTLAKRIYHHVQTCGQFQCRAFAKVSRNPDMRRLLTTIFTQIQIQSPPDFSSSSFFSSSEPPAPARCMDAQDLIANIQHHLRYKRYLIIIDDLWSASVWDIIRRAFPDNGCHSRIITTTQFEDVASACCSYQSKYMSEIKPLKHGQSEKLFFSMFGSEYEVGLPKDFGEVSDEIIQKCGGLPLSIVNIASMLPAPSKQNLQEWMDIRDSLPSALRANPTPEGIKQVLNLIYNNLTPQLKTCLMYLVLYPEGCTISKDDLAKQWVVEGIIEEGQNKAEVAGGYFDELVSRGMIQVVDNYLGVLSCTLHHMVYDLIVKKSVEENFIVVVDYSQPAIGLPPKVRRLSVQFGGARSARIPAGIMVSEVRSLAFFGFCGCTDFIEEYKLLRVLVLHVWDDQGDATFELSGISKLLALRYLKIECNTAVKLPVPAQFGDLQHLEVDTPVLVIPSDIGGFSRLSKLKIAVRALSRKHICILGALPALSALSLHVWTTPVEMIVFEKGDFLVLKSFEFRCPVPWLKFEAGSMPDLRNLNLCFNAREADQHGIVPIGMEHLSGLKEITAHIWGSDTDVGSTFRTTISNHPSNPRIYMQLVNPIFHGAATTSVGTIKVEDEKKQAADIRMSTLPRSKRKLNLPGSSSRVPVQAGSLTFTSGGSNNMADGPSRVPLHSLESMTDNFSEGRLLGSGSYGKVYLGEQEDGQKIAIKILHQKLGHDDVQFEKELYNLANLQHQNIVRLVGYCHETRREVSRYNETIVLAEVTNRALCFEFMENGSLSLHLFDEFNGHGWRKRYAIIKGICNGLKYLHEELKPPTFHLDLKPANILLDKNMIPKIADVGLSRFFKEEKSHITNSTIGTLGYLPPEFIHHGIISNKLDVFSLGVVVIEIIAGPTGHCRSAEMTSKQFIEIVHGNWRNRLQSAASGDLLESYSEQVKRCIIIALSCVEDDRRKRPTIGDIVNMLTETETIENYHGALIDQ